MKFYIFLLSIGFFLFGCDDLFRMAPPASPTPTPPVMPPSTDPTEPSDTGTRTTFGVVKCNPAEQERFNRNLAVFLSSVKDPNSVSPVDCTGSEKVRGGMFMQGRVDFANNQMFNPSSISQQLQVSSGNLVVLIQDIAGQKMRFNYTAEPYTSVIRGQNINLTFTEDQGIGTITLSGQVQDGKFEGVFSFNNRIRYDRLGNGSTGYFELVRF